MSKLKAAEVRNTSNGTVIGWDTTCDACGIEVHFKKGSNRFAPDTSPTKPDDTARCHTCWSRASARWRRDDRIRRGLPVDQ